MADKKITNEISANYKLVGLATSLKEYKLCYYLNIFLNCDFQKLNDLVFEPTDRTRAVSFSVFKAGNDDDKNQFIVFSNKSLSEILLPEISNFDYLIQINGKYDEDEMKSLLTGVKQFPGVLMTAEIPLRKIRSKDRLIYREEKPAPKPTFKRKFKL